MNKELATSSTLSHYRIVSKIGSEGMGEVYLGPDTKLDHKVALKILPGRGRPGSEMHAAFCTGTERDFLVEVG